jgi:cytochrome c oxidase assembly protein subunit 15
MSVPDWPGTYGYNLFRYPLTLWLSGPWDLFIEHGHRLLGSAAGLITILLMVTTWRADHRPWVRWYTVGCLGLVIAQGILGGMRVLLNETLLARIHGCVGPLFLVAGVGAAAITSHWWSEAMPVHATKATAVFMRLAWITAGVAYLQLVLGAHVRHVQASWSPNTYRIIVLAHLLGAVVLTGHTLAMFFMSICNRQIRDHRLLLRPVLWLVALLFGQLLIGAGVWRLKYDWPAWIPQPTWLRGYTVTAESMLQSVTVTVHVAAGSLIVATAVLLAVRSSRVFTAAEVCSTGYRTARRALEVLV